MFNRFNQRSFLHSNDTNDNTRKIFIPIPVDRNDNRFVNQNNYFWLIVLSSLFSLHLLWNQQLIILFI